MGNDFQPLKLLFVTDYILNINECVQMGYGMAWQRRRTEETQEN